MLRVIAGCLGLLLSALPCACALADAFPNKPIRLIVGAGPGSVSDVRSRWVAQRLAPVLGQPVVVENRAGAGGSIAAESPEVFAAFMSAERQKWSPIVREANVKGQL